MAVILVATGGSEEGATAAAPSECLDAWNSDEAALSYARHNRTFHRSSEVQVGYMDPAADPTLSSDPGAGSCAVVFARASIDPELPASGEVEQDGGWVPLSEFLEESDLARLQSEAIVGANAVPTAQGELAPKPGGTS